MKMKIQEIKLITNIKNSIIKFLSKLTKKKEEFLIYLVTKDIDEVGEDKESMDEYLEEDF